MRTLAHTGSGPVHFALEADAATTIEVYAEKRRTAEVRLEPVDPRDSDAAELIEHATAQSTGKRFAVRVPSAPRSRRDRMTVIRNGGSVVISGGTVTGTVTGMVLGSGVTVVNGRVISGSGTTILTGSGGIRITIRLPLGSELAVTSLSGDVTTHGPLPRVETTGISGDVHLDQVGVAEVCTTSGDVRITHADRVDVNATSGDVTVRNLGGRAEVCTVSGDIAVHAVRASTVRARAVSGDIAVTADAGVEVASDTRTVSGRTRNRRR
jgi:hypothetical protein